MLLLCVLPVASEVVEYNLSTRQLVWSYGGDPANSETQFYSGFGSQVYRLPNGNTLMVVSGEGRVIEVTREGETVWKYVTPDRSGEDDELIATVVLSERLSPETPLDWRSC